MAQPRKKRRAVRRQGPPPVRSAPDVAIDLGQQPVAEVVSDSTADEPAVESPGMDQRNDATPSDATPSDATPSDAAPDGDEPGDVPPAEDAAYEIPTETVAAAPVDAGPVDDDPATPAAEGGNMPVSTRHAWRRLERLLKPRISTGNVLAALMTLAVGFALVAQVQNAQGGGLQDLSETELVALLDDVSERADSLEEEIRLLEADRRTLEQGSGVEAAEAAQARLTSNQILAGSVPVIGPGITMSVSAPEGGFTPTMMIDVMQELRNAGAEAIQFGTVRVVANTWIGTEDGQLTVDGQIVEAPFRILAIGDSHTLSGAMAIPGGFTDSVRGIGGDVQIVEGESLLIDSLKITGEPRYARPVPSE
ncbi:DUF881 domain-containing protein [Ornithinimicrobium cryptoxanthini]|uniref:DUF881 domain-containing protein n=1 Tax=Ornithinimicrobium cryptoxanthini TaxID=2934161 RepID=UPI002119A900|nr:DUF881 domain-containing protein [Ornithinimicrobium cryptoxanthini]